MKHTASSLISAVAVASFVSVVQPVFGQVEAQSDLYTTPVDTPIDVASPGVLLNDAAEDSIGARLVTGPVHGEATLLTNGALSYTPNTGYEGHDSLSYVAQVLRPIAFVIDSTSSTLQLDAHLSSSFGSDDDRETSRLGGRVAAFLIPHEPPYAEVHVDSLQIDVLDELNFSFSVTFISLRADVERGDMTVAMQESGGPGAAEGTEFDQGMNHVQLDATIILSGSIISTSEEHVVFDDTVSFVGTIDLNAAGDSLILTLPLELEGSHSTSGADVQFTGSGMIYAVAPYEPAEESDETFVLFEVGTPSTSIEPDELPTATRLHPAYPNPFNPQATVTYELASESDVRLSLFDVTGREVLLLVSRRQPAGVYEVRMEAGDLSSGVYLLRLRTESLSRTSRVVLAK